MTTKQSKLKLLTRRRTNVLGSVNLIKTFDDEYDPTKERQVQVRIERLDGLSREFEELQDEIEIIEEADEEFSEERQNFQTLYFELKASLQAKLPQAPPVSPQVRQPAVPNLLASNLRLPEIKLKEFSGNLEDWVSFRDLYISLIHTNLQLSAVQKLHYLRATLSGEAARVIASLEISADNYAVAWGLLKDRYENPSLLIKRHMSALLSIPPLKRESAIGLAELADEFDRHVQLLDKLENADNHWKSFLIERLSQCLDSVTLREWETHIATGAAPTYRGILEFIHQRSRIIQTLKLSHPANAQPEVKLSKSRNIVAHVVSENVPRCASCKNAHYLFQCDSFKALSPHQRFELAKKQGLCINCLKGTHLAKHCSSGSCKSCSKKHHSLLHLPPITSNVSSPAANKPSQWQSGRLSHFAPSQSPPPEECLVAAPPVESSVRTVTSRGHFLPPSSRVPAGTVTDIRPSTSYQSAEVRKCCQSTVLLSTAVIKVRDDNNNYLLARALLDSGSQPSFISEDLCQRLRLNRTKINSPISGIGQSTVNVHYGVTLHLASRFGNFCTTLDCLVLPKLTIALPSHHIDVSRWRIPRHLPLADPQFNVSQGVDIIIGAALFFDLLEHQQIYLNTGYPSLQKTVLGYIVCGKICQPPTDSQNQTSLMCIEDNIDAQLERFWEIENFDTGKALTPEEQYCEDHFTATTERDVHGRYVVRFPLKEEKLPFLGESYHSAHRRFSQMERKFATDPTLRSSYQQFMEEYESMGHMELSTCASSKPQFYLPHHAIQRPESSTTKIRVVFDGSCHSSAELSLNDVLYVGPTVQPTLFTIVANFRLPRFAVIADAEKMFRQIWIHPEDRKFQQILYRKDPSEAIQTFQLKTVTYGLASSPFHATRVLNQLADDEGKRFPLAVPVVRKGVYVDDVITGHDNLGVMSETCNQLKDMLQSAGFLLRKWATNCPAVLSNIPKELWETATELELDRSPAVKTLGLLWFPQRDLFKFKVPVLQENNILTKRKVVSEMSQLFDPLGLLGPVIVSAKMFVQILWAAKLSWDVELPEELSSWWREYRSGITALHALEVPRRVIWNTCSQYTMHCFCDASKKGYGCCVYIVSADEHGELHSELLTSKSRVAPLRGQSIPRLELCAALLGSQLVHSLRSNTDFTGPVIFWSDSTIVLHWISSRSNSWKVFVSNRVAEIQRLSKGSAWRHIPTEANPADRISRGLLATQILNDKLWWHGPTFISSPIEYWPESKVLLPSQDDLREEMCPVVSLHSHDVDFNIFDRFSELGKLIRVVGLCIRFCNNCRLSSHQRKGCALTSEETNTALKCLIRLAQLQDFPNEVRRFRNNQEEHISTPKSPLKDMNVTMDDFGLLRINGRLANTNLPFDTRYPILLPAKHQLSWMIMQTLHGGPSLSLATVRQRFWPLRGRDLARRVVRKCVTCFRCRPTPTCQIMAPLPPVRLKPARPFTYSGMDYCGPFFVRPLSGRGSSVKMYVGLFVCMVVKAVHLEIVSDLSTIACINAVKRFVARRGRVVELHCDNATAFVGADRELRSLRKQFLQQFKDKEWGDYCTGSGIAFHFIPARSPHFGGIWEAGIKSFKYHFRRIMGQNSFSVDQFLTIVTQIESVLNSRPLGPLSDSPNDLTALTPAHFLIGEPLISIPEPDLNDLPSNRLTRLQEMKRSVQNLWHCWSRDYVSQLHQRSKWKRPAADVREGQLVLLKLDHYPPLQWPLGRIISAIPGQDGRVRVVVVKTATGQYKRAITEISVLPTDPEGDKDEQEPQEMVSSAVIG